MHYLRAISLILAVLGVYVFIPHTIKAQISERLPTHFV